MEREGHDNVSFFVGDEVEHTPAFGKKTLFVVGLQGLDEINSRLENNPFDIRHIYFGANQSFPSAHVNDVDTWNAWENMIQYYLNRDYLCTLDIDVSCVEGLLEGGLCERHNFIPMISVKLPYIQQLGYNATIKLDDTDFAKSNHGVWCHSLHNLMDRRVFTDWSKYTKDETL